VLASSITVGLTADWRRGASFVPGTRLEALHRERKGPHSICIKWEDGKTAAVEIVDYHLRRSDLMPKLLTPIHPGEIIRKEILTPLAMSVNQLAKHLAVDTARLNEIVRGRRGITADTALRLARYLGTTPEFWLKLQVHYELRMVRQAKQKEIERTVRPLRLPRLVRQTVKTLFTVR
jgi:addiction module HigA family antidote